MPNIFTENDFSRDAEKSPQSEFLWYAGPLLSERFGSRHLLFDIRSLDPGMFSFPYHFHRNSEELFVVLSGEATIRFEKEFRKVRKGDMVFFETGPSGAHQVYNHADLPCRYLDIRTNNGTDICEYPDSGKINITPYHEIYDSGSRVDYYKNEDNVTGKWPEDILRKK